MVTFVGQTSTETQGGTLALPAGTVAGDTLVLVCSGASTAGTSDSRFTLAWSPTAYFKVYVGTADSSGAGVVWTGDGITNLHAGACMAAFRDLILVSTKTSGSGLTAGYLNTVPVMDAPAHVGICVRLNTNGTVAGLSLGSDSSGAWTFRSHMNQDFRQCQINSWVATGSAVNPPGSWPTGNGGTVQNAGAVTFGFTDTSVAPPEPEEPEDACLADVTGPWTLNVIALSAAGPSMPDQIKVAPTDADPAYDPSDVQLVLPEPGAPDPPVLTELIAGNEAIAVGWTAPECDGGSTITGYVVQATSGESTVTVGTLDAVSTTLTVGPLTNGHEYTVVVRALNALGPSLNSNSMTATPSVTGSYVPPPPETGAIAGPAVEPIPAPTLRAFDPTVPFAPENYLREGQVVGAFTQIALVEVYTDVDGVIRVKDSFPICPSFGVVWYTQVDLGYPDVRASSQESPGIDGTIDATKLTGARNVSIEGVVLNNAFGAVPAVNAWPTDVSWNSASWFCSYLSGWAAPARRFRLYLTDESGRSRFMDVRGDTFTSQIDRTSKDYRTFQLQLVCPSGKLHSFAYGSEVTIDGRYRQPLALTSSGLTGRVYDRGYDRTYPDERETPAELFYTGTVPTGFIAEIYTGSAPLSGLRIRVTAPDQTKREIGLDPAYAVPAHTRIVFNTGARTVVQIEDNTTVRASLEQYLSAPLQWPQLQPGINYDRGLTAKQRGQGYNGFQLFADSAPATDATFIIYHHAADLL